MKKYRKFGDDFDFQLYDLETSEYVCANHIDEDFIKNKIRKEGEIGKCTYCKKKEPLFLYHFYSKQ